MPIFGISILFQILCIVHIIRTGRDRIWIYVVIFLPAAGILAYLLVEILPSLFRGRAATRISGEIRRQVDPGRDIRARRRALEVADTTENRRQLGEALLEAGQYDEAAELYERTLVGIHRDDPALLFGLARARAGQGDYAACLRSLDELAQGQRGDEPIERRLFRAICLEHLGRSDEARAQYAAIADRYPGEEARCRYAASLAAAGHAEEARQVYEEILRRSKLAPGHYRRAQQPWIDQARRALAATAG
jgi:hypothetical protein